MLNNSLSIYIHNCNYFKRGIYYKTIIKEINAYFALLDKKIKINTIFFGGKSHRYNHLRNIQSILQAIKNFGIQDNCEISIEVSPEKLDYNYIYFLKRIGFTRISIKARSSVDHVLRSINKKYSFQHILKIVKYCKYFKLNTNLDLYYGIPKENILDWRQSLNDAISISPEHISIYEFTSNKLSQFAQSPDIKAKKYEIADLILSNYGYKWYEINHWALEEKFYFQHNLNYWKKKDWIGVGAGAHSHIRNVRWSNCKNPNMYIKYLYNGNLPIENFEILTKKAVYEEHFLLSMYLKEGILKEEINKNLLLKWQSLDYIYTLNSNKKYLELTLKGRLLADFLIKQLLI